MIRLMTEEVNEALASLETEQGEREEEISIATGMLSLLLILRSMLSR